MGELTLVPKQEDKDTIIVSASSLNVIDTCKKKYEYYKIRGLGTSGPKNEKLERGDLIHQIADVFYKGMINGSEDRGTCIQKALDHGRFISATELDLEIEAVEYYIDVMQNYFEVEADFGWKPLYSEEPFSVILFEDETLRVLLEGKIDLVVEVIQSGQKIVIDHKSKEKTSTPSEIENQFQTYGFAFRDVTNMVMVNQIGLHKNREKRFRHFPMTFHDSVLAEWERDTVFKIKELYWFIKNDYFPRSYQSCSYCEFERICREPVNLRERMIEAHYEQSKPFDLFAK